MAPNSVTTWVNYFQMKSRNMPLAKLYPDESLGDYFYKMDISLVGNARCSVSGAEQVAVAMSAMMNTSGGVLEVGIDTGTMGAGGWHENKLQELGSQLLRIISVQESWIPKHLLSSNVRQCVQKNSSKIYFFVNNAKELVTHHSFHTFSIRAKSLSSLTITSYAGCCENVLVKVTIDVSITTTDSLKLSPRCQMPFS